LCTVNNVFLNNTISSFHDLKHEFNMRNGKIPVAYKHDKQGKGLSTNALVTDMHWDLNNTNSG